jgi:hypothetical protein
VMGQNIDIDRATCPRPDKYIGTLCGTLMAGQSFSGPSEYWRASALLPKGERATDSTARPCGLFVRCQIKCDWP